MDVKSTDNSVSVFLKTPTKFLPPKGPYRKEEIWQVLAGHMLNVRHNALPCTYLHFGVLNGRFPCNLHPQVFDVELFPDKHQFR